MQDADGQFAHRNQEEQREPEETAAAGAVAVGVPQQAGAAEGGQDRDRADVAQGRMREEESREAFGPRRRIPDGLFQFEPAARYQVVADMVTAIVRGVLLAR